MTDRVRTTQYVFSTSFEVLSLLQVILTMYTAALNAVASKKNIKIIGSASTNASHPLFVKSVTHKQNKFSTG